MLKRIIVIFIISSQLLHAGYIRDIIRGVRRLITDNVADGYKMQGMVYDSPMNRTSLSDCEYFFGNYQGSQVFFRMYAEDKIGLRYCREILAPSVREYFSKDYGLPMNVLKVAKSEIENTYQRNSHQLNSEQNNWHVVYELNLDAADIWQELLDRSESEEDARAMLYTLLTKKNKNRSSELKELKSRILLFKNNVRNMLETTIFYIDLDLQNPFKFHPLFVQTLVEAFLIHRIYLEDEMLKKRGHINSITLQQARAQYLREYLVEEDKDKLHTGISFVSSRYDYTDVLESAFNFIRFDQNITFLLSVTVNPRECDFIGLWPSVTRSFFQTFSFGREDTYFLARELVLKDKFKANIQQACGKPSMGILAHEMYASFYAYQDSFVRMFTGEEK